MIKKLEEVVGIKFNSEQLDILNHRGGMRIIACAGSGKTTMLSSLIVKRILSGEIKNTSRILCTTYSRVGAIHLENKVNSLLSKFGYSGINVKTMHAVYLDILRRFGYPTDIVDNSMRMKFIWEACKVSGVTPSEDLVKSLDAILSYQVNNLMSDNTLANSYIFNIDNMDIGTYSKIRNNYNYLKQSKGLIDFDDMQLYVYSLMVREKKEEVIGYCRAMWKYFFIDEAQDISKLQFEILKVMIEDEDDLVFIGDDDQCIYQWRGAEPSIVLNVCGYYNLKTFTLSTNYRCRGNILELASRSIKYNSRRYSKDMKYANSGGNIYLIDTSGGGMYYKSLVVLDIVKDLINKGKDLSDIAILARNNQQLAILNSLLVMNGIMCSSTNEMRFTKGMIYQDIKDIINILLGRRYNYSTLGKLVLYLGKKSKFIYDLQVSLGVGLSDVLGVLLKKKDIGLPLVVQRNIEEYINSLNVSTKDSINSLYEILSSNENMSIKLNKLLSMYWVSYSYAFNSFEKKEIMYGYIEYISDICSKHGIEYLNEYLVKNEQYETDLYVSNFKNSIFLSTFHGSKGMEWDTVIIFNDENISVPSFEGIARLYHRGIDMYDILYNVEEERRLHYVALTRAKENLYIISNKNNASIFLLEGIEGIKYNNEVVIVDIIKMADRNSVGSCKVEGVDSKFIRYN
ncbi:MAG: ATP-dependent helicase [Candidatus Anstonellales archaeon]